MQIETVKIAADNAKGYKIVNADDPRAAEPEKPKRQAARKAKDES